ncbi:hypothetical protein H4582DRAFT_1895712 [Lactarius indigo]|nr:hypothetical protein H4582DRAFT_1895712 [Lactarius indigo]
MTLTRSAARALLTNRSDVLLEIFDAYRQFYEHQPDYEKVWSSRDGWLKLVHVCLRWRRVVLLSSSRRLHRIPVLKSLPPLPILVDYRDGPWTEKEEKFVLAALSHHSRVRRVALRRPYTKRHMAKLLKALSHPFPELESLEIFPVDDRGAAYPRYYRAATGLVELTLTVKVTYRALPEASFISNLQRMSRLRRLELQLVTLARATINDNTQPPTGAGDDIVTLPELMRLVYIGDRPYLEALVAVLAAPSLQNLDVALGFGSTTGDFPIPHLYRFIRGTDKQFITVRLEFSLWRLKFSAGTGSQSVHDQPFSIVLPAHVSLEQLGRELSGPLSTVEELIIEWVTWAFEPRSIQPGQMRGFYHYLPQVKIVQVPAEVALGVARSFKGDGAEPILHLLPALERIEVRSAAGEDDTHPLIAAWQRAGRPIRLSTVVQKWLVQIIKPHKLPCIW